MPVLAGADETAVKPSVVRRPINAGAGWKLALELTMPQADTQPAVETLQPVHHALALR
jgi:hypothetical protein